MSTSTFVTPDPGPSPAPDSLPTRRAHPAVALHRLEVWLMLAAAITWVLLGAESTVRGGERHFRDVVWNIPWVLTMATFVVVHRAQHHELSRSRRVAAAVLAVSMVAVLAGNIGVITDNDALAALGFPVGPTVWVVAMVVYGVATIRADVLPRRVGWAIILLEPLSIVAGVVLSPIAGLHDRGNFSGAIEKGIVVWLIAAALVDSARTAVESGETGLADR